MGLEDALRLYYSHSCGSGSAGGTIFKLPRSAIVILEELVGEEPMTPKDIAEKVGYAPRTISFALRKLLKREIVKKIPNLQDMRQPKYYVKNPDFARQLIDRYPLNIR